MCIRDRQPVLDWLAQGVLNSVNLLTDGLARLPDVIKTMTDFITNIIDRIFDAEGVYDTNIEAISAFFKKIGSRFSEYSGDDFLGSFEASLYKFWNTMIDVLDTVIFWAIDTVNKFAGKNINIEDFLLGDDRKINLSNANLASMGFIESIDTTGDIEQQIADMTSVDAARVAYAAGEFDSGGRFAGIDVGDMNFFNPTTGEVKSADAYETAAEAAEDGFYPRPSKGFERTEQYLSSLSADDINRMQEQNAIRASFRLLDDEPEVDGTKMPALMEITGVNSHFPTLPDTICLPDDIPPGGVYTEMYNKATKSYEPIPLDANDLARLTRAVQAMQDTGGATPPGGTPVPTPPKYNPPSQLFNPAPAGGINQGGGGGTTVVASSQSSVGGSVHLHKQTYDPLSYRDDYYR